MHRLSEDFYSRDTAAVAKGLLGCVLRHVTRAGPAEGVIVETEAYLGVSDGASHARFGRTRRGRLMFGQPGIAYVYFIYGMHYMFNAVTEPHGVAGAVLVRALEPRAGIELMAERRGVTDRLLLTSGPARLTQALGIGAEQNGSRLDSGPLGIWEPEVRPAMKVSVTGRVGVVGSRELPLRYFIAGNAYVSK